MRKILPFILVFTTSCWGVRSVNHVARKNDMSVKRVGGINLMGGKLQVDSQVVDKDGAVYLFYKDGTLVNISDSKEVSHMGEFLYRVERPGDSIYMLTRRAQFRYYTEDTVLFHSDYIVSHRVLYDRDPMGKQKCIGSDLNTYHFSSDSVITYSYRSAEPFMGIHRYNTESIIEPGMFNASRSYRVAQARGRVEDIIHQVIR